MANWASIERLGNPADPAWQKQNLRTISPVPGQSWQVYAPAAQAFEGLLGDLVAAGYKPTSSGGFNYRNIRGSNKLSQHAFGTAIDINAAANPMLGRGDAVVTDLPPNTAELAKKWGLEWGGTWKRPDAMHFEYVGTGGNDPVSEGATMIAAANPQTTTPSRRLGDVLAAAGTTPTEAPGPVPSAFFGDVVGPQQPVDFGTVIASYLATRQQQAAKQAAEQERRNALLSQVGSVFG